MSDDPVTLRIGDVARMLSVSRSTLERWIKSGTFVNADVRIGGVNLWTRALVDEWVIQNRSTPVID